MIKLKNCPHCGGEVVLCKLNTMVTVAEFSIVCAKCGFDMGKAIKAITDVYLDLCPTKGRWRKDSFDYVYAIEGRHGDKRFHIHLVLRDADFTLEEVRFLWPGGQFPPEGEKNNG